jgi:hypothetical protein
MLEEKVVPEHPPVAAAVGPAWKPCPDAPGRFEE